MALSYSELQRQTIRSALELRKSRPYGRREWLADALLSRYDTRGRCRIVRDDMPVYITEPAERRGRKSELPAIEPAHLVTLEHELRWLPGLVHGYPENYPDPHHVVILSERLLKWQTTQIDDTRWWHWAALRQSRIKHSDLAEKVDVVRRPRRSDEVAIRRFILSIAFRRLSDGELRALALRFCGLRMTSGQRTQLERATEKISTTCRRFAFLMHVNREGGEPRGLKRTRRTMHRHACFGHAAFEDPDEEPEINLVVRADFASAA
jgi:hypothetical protein